MLEKSNGRCNDAGRAAWMGRACILADEVSITLLLVGQGVEVLGNLEPHDARRGICEIATEVFGIHGGGEASGMEEAADSDCYGRLKDEGFAQTKV
jgi:hypothetical protein